MRETIVHVWKSVVAGTLVVVALGIGTAGVEAAPAGDQAVGFTTRTTPTSATIKTDAGSMAVEDGVFKIKSPNGATLAGADMKFRVGDFEFPIAADIADRTATLIPQFDVDHAVYKPVALPFEDLAPFKTPFDREQAAFNRLKDTIALGATVGTAVGGLGGSALGCVLGGVAGATVTAATIVGLFGPFLPAGVLGCLGGIAAVGALGTLAGQLLITAPVTILAAVQYFATVNQPFPAK
ncbi:hypothetical protein [Nocardia sp. NPDC006630]|uniref:hypothetical protein n=1 Tax=Nocardia sp. NPDC006630 TaxID=3157181 RepID=UPI0033AEDC36